MIILGIDLGKARTGVAICDRGELLASPLTVVQEHNRERLVERLTALARLTLPISYFLFIKLL